MKTARVVVLANSVAAGGLAIDLLNGSEPQPVDAPVATSDIQIGQLARRSSRPRDAAACRPARLSIVGTDAATTRETTR